jgi:hypothetical protein
MRSNFARLLLILTALWLPLQAVAGMTMKMVAPVTAPAGAMEQVAEDACPYHRQADVPAPAKPRPAQQQACDNCGICHLAATGYMPVAAIVAALVPTAQAYLPAPAVERPSHIPEPPHYPPKRA